MPLPKKYQSPDMLMNKMSRQAAYLEEEVTWELFNEFALSAYHLCDWIVQDQAASPDALQDVKTLRDTLEIQACRDAANTYKHRKITKYSPKNPPKTKDTNVDQGWGVGGFGKGGYGIGEEQVTISMTDGTVFDGLELTRRVVALWNDFFKRHPKLLLG